MNQDKARKVLSALESCKTGGYRDIDGDWCKRQVFDENAITEAAAIMREEAEGWMPIETAPNDMFSYLFLCNGVALQGFRDATDALFVCQEDGRHRWRLMRRKPTNWMPLPPPPALLEKAR